MALVTCHSVNSYLLPGANSYKIPSFLTKAHPPPKPMVRGYSKSFRSHGWLRKLRWRRLPADGTGLWVWRNWTRTTPEFGFGAGATSMGLRALPLWDTESAPMGLCCYFGPSRLRRLTLELGSLPNSLGQGSQYNYSGIGITMLRKRLKSQETQLWPTKILISQ